jgi:hypothetical protein
LIKPWRYVEYGPFAVLGTPIFITIAWFAAIIIFLWALPKDEPTWIHYLYIGLYAYLGMVLYD